MTDSLEKLQNTVDTHNRIFNQLNTMSSQICEVLSDCADELNTNENVPATIITVVEQMTLFVEQVETITKQSK